MSNIHPILVFFLLAMFTLILKADEVNVTGDRKQTVFIKKEENMKILSKVFKSLFFHRLPVTLFVLFIFAIFQVGCSTLELNSNWRDREITIDGENSEWMGAMWHFEDENISVGLLNDDNYIYVCMIAEDPLIRAQVMRQGFTVWFDPAGGKEKTFGIRFPIGMPARDVPWGEREREPDPEKIRRAFSSSMDELEILGPGKDDQRRLLVKEAKGVDIMLKTSDGLLVYELRVPLLHSEQHPYAVGAETGDLIGIGLEMPEIEMPNVRRQMGGEMGGGAGPPGMGGGRRPQMPQGIKIWAIVQLASSKQ